MSKETNNHDAQSHVTSNNVDLTNCDREPIHLINAIQPHGVLWVLDESTLQIVQASANSASFFGLSCTEVIGQTLDSLLAVDAIQTLTAQLASTELTLNFAYLLTSACIPGSSQRFHVFGNRIDGLLLLEFERPAAAGDFSDIDQFLKLSETIQQLRGSSSLLDFITVAVTQIRNFTGFERVMAYRFDTDGSGEVIAEAINPELEAYLGLHYPATDIPLPARRLFALSPLRHLPDVDYVPVPLLPEFPRPDAQLPVDLSSAFLRSVSVTYTGYLRNMGVKATLVMPLMKEGKLWGLVSCMHHSTPKYVPYERRIPIELLGQIVSQMMNDRENLDHYTYLTHLDQTQRQLSDALDRIDNIQDALILEDVNLLSVLDAVGAALMINGNLTLLGQTPAEYHVSLLAAWLAQQDELVFCTRNLSRLYPEAKAFSQQASGLLSVRWSRKTSDGIIWFRPEEPQEVHWAGNPNKPVEVSQVGDEVILSPRASFALWTEVSQGQSRRWLDCELDYANALSQTVFTAIVERATVFAHHNEELELSNMELNAFAYAASHDLKEPLRGIHNFAELLKMESGKSLSESGMQRLETILGLAKRMDNLLESLMRYSRIGLTDLDLQKNAIGSIVAQTIEVFKQAYPEAGVIFTVQADLPVLLCDRMRVDIIFSNLILNANKYNDKTNKTVDIGCDVSVEPPVFYVRDNGIGIHADYHDFVFQLFRRLHNREEFGAGNGTGLTITQKAIKRHGGRIWLDSSPGLGSTFYFTLAPEQSVNREVL